MRFYKFRDNPPRLQYTRTPPRTPPSSAKSPARNPPSPPHRNSSLSQENPPKNRVSRAEQSPRFKAPFSNRLSFPKGVNPFDKSRGSSSVTKNPPQVGETPLQSEPRPQARINFPRGVTLTLHGQSQGTPDREQGTTQGEKSPQRFQQTSLGGARFPKGVGAIPQEPEQEVRVTPARFPRGVGESQQPAEQEVRVFPAKFPTGLVAIQQAPEQEVKFYRRKATSPKLETAFPAENTHPTRVALPRGASLPHQETLHTPRQTQYPPPTTFPKGVEPFQKQTITSYHPVDSRAPLTRVTLPKGTQLLQQVQNPSHHQTKNAPRATFPKGAVPFHQDQTQQEVEGRSPTARVTLPKGAYLPQQTNQPIVERKGPYHPPGRFPKGVEPFHKDHTLNQQVENRSPTARVTLPKGAHLPQQTNQNLSERESSYPLGRFPKGAEPFHKDHTLNQQVENRSPTARVTLPKGAHLPKQTNQSIVEREGPYHPPGRFPKGAEPFHQDHTHHHQQPVGSRVIARATLPKGAHLPQENQDLPEREGRYKSPARFPKGVEPFHRDYPLQADRSQIEGDSVPGGDRNPHQVSAPPRGQHLNFPKGVAPIEPREYSPLEGNNPDQSEPTARAGSTPYQRGNLTSPRSTSQQTERIVHLNQNTDQNRETLPWEGSSTNHSQNRPRDTVILTQQEAPTPDSSEGNTPYTHISFSPTQNHNPPQTTDRGVILNQDQKPPPYSITTTRVTTNIGYKPPVAPRKSLEDLNQEFCFNRGNYLNKNSSKSPIGSPQGSFRSPKSPIRSPPGRSPVRSGRSRLSGRFGSKSEPRLDRHACGSACTLTLYFSPSSPTSSPRRAYKSADDLCDSSIDAFGSSTSSGHVYNSSNDDRQSTTTTSTTTAPSTSSMARPTSSTARYIRTALSPIWFRIPNSDSTPSSTLYNTSIRPISSCSNSSTGATRPYNRTIWRSEITPRRPQRSLAQREVSRRKDVRELHERKWGNAFIKSPLVHSEHLRFSLRMNIFRRMTIQRRSPNYHYHPQTKYGEGNVFIHVSHSVHRGVCLPTMPWGSLIPTPRPKADPPQKADHPPKMWRSGGQYASFWNAYLFSRFLQIYK